MEDNGGPTEPTPGHSGDVVFEMEDDIANATWKEVAQGCCVHTPQEWRMIVCRIIAFVVFLYFFWFGLDLLANSAMVMGGCHVGALFGALHGADIYPTGVVIGILSTILLQSSSTTISIVFLLVGSVVSFEQGIYIIMGATIGTSVMGTIVALGHLGDGDRLERAFAGAVVHDLFTFLSVCCLLPIEAAAHFYRKIAIITFRMINRKYCFFKWEGLIKKFVSPLRKTVIIANTRVIEQVAKGKRCQNFYPTRCDGGIVSYRTCDTGLIACNNESDDCPAFFSPNATIRDDKVSGSICFFIGLFIMLVCLAGLIKCLQKLVLGMSARIIYKATNANGCIAMVMGFVMMIIVQSSSIITSSLIPLVGMGVLRLEQMFPLTLGVNIGTSVTSMRDASVIDRAGPLRLAFFHLAYNITGILFLYPIPFIRRIPLAGARRLGKGTRLWRGFPTVYIFVFFFLAPFVLQFIYIR